MSTIQSVRRADVGGDRPPPHISGEGTIRDLTVKWGSSAG